MHQGPIIKPISLFFACLLFAGGLVAARPAAEQEPEAQRLFRIERSKNANIVVYDAQLRRDGELDAKKPVIAYWLKLAQDGARGKLSLMQKRFAYGFKAKFVDDDTLVLKMSADIDRDIVVDVVDGVSRAFVEIGGHRAVLDRIYVKSIETKMWPSVEFLELFGVDLETGEQRYERIYP